MIKPTFLTLKLCSGHFLCQVYPDNWEDLKYNKQLEFISDNLWEQVENSPPEIILDAIYDAAICTQTIINETVAKEQIKKENKIYISWCIEDVIETNNLINERRFERGEDARTLNEDDARKILAWIERKHDASIGINWDVIECFIDMYFD